MQTGRLIAALGWEGRASARLAASWAWVLIRAYLEERTGQP
jgi:hypothetical protein